MSKFNIDLSNLTHSQLIDHYWKLVEDNPEKVATGKSIAVNSSYRYWGSFSSFHNDNFPARIWLNKKDSNWKCQEWFSNGLEHRIDGPAIINTPYTFQWWYNGKNVTGKQCKICLRLDCPTTKENFYEMEKRI